MYPDKFAVGGNTEQFAEFDPGAEVQFLVQFLLFSEGSLLFLFIVDILIFPYLKYYCSEVYKGYS